MKSKNTAFTLLETLLVLTIVIGVVLLPTILTDSYQNKRQERIFFDNFKQTWRHARQVCLLDNTAMTVKFDNANHRVLFIGSNQRTKNFARLYFPESLTQTSSTHSLTIDKGNNPFESYVSPKSIVFDSTLTGKTTTFTVQMKWGVLIEK